jgi:hypothetical protein
MLRSLTDGCWGKSCLVGGRYFLPSANLPKVAGCKVMTAGPLVLPAMIGLFGTVSYA